MRLRAGRKQQRDAVMRGVSEMCDQLSAGPDGLWVRPASLRHLGDEREVADKFAAAAEVACGRDADDIGRRLFQMGLGGFQKLGRAVHMALAV